MYLRCLLYSSLKLGEGKKKNAPLPASSAGLLRFFEDETRGYKVKPEIILGITGVCHWFVNYNKNNFSSVRRYLIINENDSVTSIHKRWLLTQINPSSYKTSLAISLLASLIVSGIYFFSTRNYFSMDNYLYFVFTNDYHFRHLLGFISFKRNSDPWAIQSYSCICIF